MPRVLSPRISCSGFSSICDQPQTWTSWTFCYLHSADFSSLRAESLCSSVCQEGWSACSAHASKSGGTLFALGADDIVMTRLATLSPIYRSITGLLNPVIEMVPGPGVQPQRMPVPVAVESVAGFKKLVREEWRLDEEGATHAFYILLADKVNPLLLGDLQRSKEQIVRLATNLMKLHMKETDKINAVVEMLATGSGLPRLSHWSSGSARD